MLLVLAISGITGASAQVSIAPTQLFIHEKQGVGEIFLTNTSDTAQEITFDFQFGYPVSTEEGAISMVYDDSLTKERYGLEGRVRLFPSRVIIPPNWSQTIRVQVLPMNDRPDGVYWSRLLVASSAITPDADAQNSEGITTDINYVLEQNIPLFYRHGENSTGVRVTDIRTSVDESSNQIVVIPKLERTGNSPYLGTMHAKLFDATGELIEKKEVPAYFYFEDWRRLTFKKPEISEGSFRLDLEFQTRRRSISSGDIVKADDQVHTVQIFP